jgi:hypothetical protein
MTTPYGRFVNLAGHKFGRLSVIKYIGSDKQRGAIWRCVCDCGKRGSFKAANLNKGKTRSCGCLKRDEFLARITTHAATSTPEHVAWINMRARCSRSSHPQFKDYGGRGIKVCRRWNKFESFLDDVGCRPSRIHSLHRIDNNSGYRPDNVKWAIPVVQQNARRTNSRVRFNGRIQTVAQWARELGFEFATLQHRIRRGWSIKEALTTPLVFKRKGSQNAQ